MTIEERIAQRIAEIEAEMNGFTGEVNEFIKNANIKHGQYQARLAELKRLIEPVEETVKDV